MNIVNQNLMSKIFCRSIYKFMRSKSFFDLYREYFGVGGKQVHKIVDTLFNVCKYKNVLNLTMQ